MCAYGYQYLFLSAQGDIPDGEFDFKNFYKIFAILIGAQVFCQFSRGFIVYNFALEVSGKLNSLGIHNTQALTDSDQPPSACLLE